MISVGEQKGFMTKTLFVKGGVPRPAPTTTTKLAHRLLAASFTMAEHLPRAIVGSPALDVLLSLYVAEEDARYLTIGELTPTGGQTPAVMQRWAAYLVQLGLVDRRADMLALSTDGHTIVTDALEAMFVAQRALD